MKTGLSLIFVGYFLYNSQDLNAATTSRYSSHDAIPRERFPREERKTNYIIHPFIATRRKLCLSDFDEENSSLQNNGKNGRIKEVEIDLSRDRIIF